MRLRGAVPSPGPRGSSGPGRPQSCGAQAKADLSQLFPGARGASSRVRNTFLCFKHESHFWRDSGSSPLCQGLRSHRHLTGDPKCSRRFQRASAPLPWARGHLHPAGLVWKGTMAMARHCTGRVMKPGISARTHTFIYVCVGIVCVYTYMMRVQSQK